MTSVGQPTAGRRGAGVETTLEPPSLAVTLVDDGLLYGGGQIGLRRYIEVPSALRRSVVLLTPSKVTQSRPAGTVPVIVAQRRPGRRGVAAAWARILTSREIKRMPRGVVVANSLMSAVVVAALPRRGRTLIYYLREDFSREWIHGVKRFLIEHVFLPRFDAFLANSAWTASTLPPRLRKKPIRVAYPLCGLSARTTRYAPHERDAAGDTALRLLSLSRITHWKGIDVVLDAAIKLAGSAECRVVLTLAGGVAPSDEEFARSLRARVLPPNLSVEFPGHVDDIDTLLHSHDVLLVCSRHPEPFGQVVIQGLAAGLSLIATDQGGPSEILANEPTARLVPADDVDATLRAMQDVLSSPPSAEQRADASSRALTRFDDNRLADEFDAAVLDLTRVVSRHDSSATQAER